MQPTHLLFICSRNQWRSPTAENLFKNHPFFIAKSAGTEPSARIRVSEKLLLWADFIFVMEKKHKQRLLQRFPDIVSRKKVTVLEIPDDYKLDDPELIEILKTTLKDFLAHV